MPAYRLARSIGVFALVVVAGCTSTAQYMQ